MLRYDVTVRIVNDGCEYKEIVPEIEHGRTLLDYLCARYDHSSREEWQRRIDEGRVLLEGRDSQAAACLRPGQQIIWSRPPWQEPDAPQDWRTLCEDTEVLAVEKPAGLPTLPGAGFYESTLLRLVQREYADAVPAHRLGRWTSGVVLFARPPQARSALAAQFAGRTIEKTYRALATGSPAEDRFDIDAAIGPVPHAVLGTVHAVSVDGSGAHSSVNVRERRENEFLCDVAITTGRPHQIRIHLAAAGYPLVGDPLYPVGGVPLPDSTALPGDRGYELHAAEITFRCVSSGERVRVESEPPDVLRQGFQRRLRPPKPSP
jgi:23S rRNA pseudouridine1911/1915/1917 synthase